MSLPSWKQLGSRAYVVSHAETTESYEAYLPETIKREDPQVTPLFATDFTAVASALIITVQEGQLRDLQNISTVPP
ncbi:hypothetical protein [Acidicapsa ligni]|uniref:hypothetical protein n=1 Tax=Acidicapsa ligni TaxID=542300 RepID=UPI0021DF6418|nr:hypothetical protein [Acidicapsa ligni]